MLDKINEQVKAGPSRSDILGRLIRFCHFNLNHDQQVREYLTCTRKLTNQTIIRFQLGAFPSLEKLARHFSEYELMVAGVLRKDEAGQISSKFTQHRIILPIFDVHNRPIAIQGRVLCSEDEREKLGLPKYDNTVYSKASNLYGLSLAKAAIRAKQAVLVVEGGFDVISAVQAGTENVVGSLGAFFGERQIALVSRYADRIYLGLDQDEAGIRAMKRVLNKPARDGILIREQRVPTGFKDWDDFFRSKITS